MTVFFITGDDGSDDGVGDGSAHVAYPGSEYGAVACGGSYITNVSGTSNKSLTTKLTFPLKVPGAPVGSPTVNVVCAFSAAISGGVGLVSLSILEP